MALVNITNVQHRLAQLERYTIELYQAFQDEKEVRIQLLRGGSTPLNITVRIK